MKKIFKYILLAGLSFGLVSCDKFFDGAEGDLSKTSAENLLASNTGLLSLLANLYSALPDMSVSTGDQNQMFANSSRSTPSYDSSVSSMWNYGAVRNVNNFMDAVENAFTAGVIDEKARDQYLGEARFLRAVYYFAGVRVYGGMPLVTESFDKYAPTDPEIFVKRSTEKETWDFVISELEEASKLLPASQSQALRANKYTALAMEARVALWAASLCKYWDRAPINASYTAVKNKLTYMDKNDAAGYYETALRASETVIKEGPYELVGQNPANIKAAIDNFVDLFQNYNAKEAIFGRSYNTGGTPDGNGNQGWGPNQLVSGYLQGTYSVSLNLADEYDYYSDASARNSVKGTIKTLISGDETNYFTDPQTQFTAADVANYKHYDSPAGPFELKDARFQAWVAYPGNTYRGITINEQGGMVKPDGSVLVYPSADNSPVMKDGVAYYPYGGEGDSNSFFFKLDVNVNDANRSFYCFQILKGIDKSMDTKTPTTPWYNMRISEMYLTYAEAQVESGKGNAANAAKYLNDVRHRAGFKDDVELNLNNVIHEWKVEFALENRWADVLTRRRAFYNPSNTPTIEEGSVGQKLTLIPLVDLSGAKAQWIFLRSLPWSSTARNHYTGTLRFLAEQYYKQIPNYQKNQIIPNNQIVNE